MQQGYIFSLQPKPVGACEVGVCSYCHTKAGLFKNAHETCTQEAESARSALRTLIADGVRSAASPEELAPQIRILKERGRLTEQDARSVLLRSADAATLELAMSAPVSNDISERIGRIFQSIYEQWFSEPTKLVNWHGYLSLLHSNVLYQVLHREVPYSVPEGFAEFRFAKGEHPILKRRAVLAQYGIGSNGGSYQGVSLPIGGGMYYRIGTSQPRTQQTGLVPIDQGLMAITTQAIYFTSHAITFRLPYTSIIRIESFVDGFGIYENHGRGKVFIPALLGTMDEGWYFYNLVSALMTW